MIVGLANPGRRVRGVAPQRRWRRRAHWCAERRGAPLARAAPARRDAATVETAAGPGHPRGADDLHERVGRRRRRRCCAARRWRTCRAWSSCTTSSTSSRAACSSRSAAASPGTTGCARSPSPSRTQRVRAAAHRHRQAARPRSRAPTTSCARPTRRAPARSTTRTSPPPADALEASWTTASRRPSDGSTGVTPPAGLRRVLDVVAPAVRAALATGGVTPSACATPLAVAAHALDAAFTVVRHRDLDRGRRAARRARARCSARARRSRSARGGTPTPSSASAPTPRRWRRRALLRLAPRGRRAPAGRSSRRRARSAQILAPEDAVRAPGRARRGGACDRDEFVACAGARSGTAARAWSSTAPSSRCAAGSSTSGRRRPSGRCAWTSSATRSSGSTTFDIANQRSLRDLESGAGGAGARVDPRRRDARERAASWPRPRRGAARPSTASPTATSSTAWRAGCRSSSARRADPARRGVATLGRRGRARARARAGSPSCWTRSASSPTPWPRRGRRPSEIPLLHVPWTQCSAGDRRRRGRSARLGRRGRAARRSARRRSSRATRPAWPRTCAGGRRAAAASC